MQQNRHCVVPENFHTPPSSHTHTNKRHFHFNPLLQSLWKFHFTLILSLEICLCHLPSSQSFSMISHGMTYRYSLELCISVEVVSCTYCANWYKLTTMNGRLITSLNTEGGIENLPPPPTSLLLISPYGYKPLSAFPCFLLRAVHPITDWSIFVRALSLRGK